MEIVSEDDNKVEMMKRLQEIGLTDKEHNALIELKQTINEDFPDAEVILFGSKAKGVTGIESDIDVLVLLEKDVDDRIRETIFHLGFVIELKYDVIFGILVQSKAYWKSSSARLMPIHQNIYNEGVAVI